MVPVDGQALINIPFGRDGRIIKVAYVVKRDSNRMTQKGILVSVKFKLLDILPDV